MADQTRPNFLIIMSDEHAPMYSGTYGHALVQTPSMDRLAREGVTFETAYCNSPLCMPSRMSFMTGQYIHEIGAWDNATPLSSDAVTWAHVLRAAGYDVVLSGKQHFMGPDQLHGFRTQLARDLHAELHLPIESWDEGTQIVEKPWGHPAKAGPGTTPELEADELAHRGAVDYLRDPARSKQPWALDVGYIAPHFPFVVPQRFWDLYPLDQVDLPQVPAEHLATLHPVYRRMRAAFGLIDFAEEEVRRARAGYYGLITYLDEKIGQLMDVLEETGQRENTVIIHTSDHGEMAGEHGMWRKSNFYEASARVPLQIAWPGRLPAGRRVAEVVSLVDLVATIVELAGVERAPSQAGDTLLPLMRGRTKGWKDEAFCEYLAHGVTGPMAMLRRGRYKLNFSLGDAVELYDVVADPQEFRDLAGEARYQPVVRRLQSDLLARWDPVALDRRVRRSQRERLLIERATAESWRDFRLG